MDRVGFVVMAESPQEHAGNTGRDGKGRFTKDVPNAWVAGRSANPGGRPKKQSLNDAILRELNAASVSKENGLALFNADAEQQRSPTVDEMARAFLTMALRGDAVAVVTLKELLDRLDGRVADRLKIEVEVGRTMNAVQSVCEQHGRLDIYEQTLERVAEGGDAEAPALEAGPGEGDG